jgi:predicted ATPase/class 3 adenylate cyclase/DNA-binding CsgD family transcriptional regulator
MTRRGEFVLPIGTVTLLLADVEASTHGWEERPDEMAASLNRLDQAVDEAVAAHAGVRPVEQGEGDSFVAAFARASDALSCALEVQRRLADEPLRLRIGVHTGEVQLRDGGRYVGSALNRAARLRDAGHGGQILLSQVSHDLIIDRLPEDTMVKDLGSHRLKDLGRPEHVFQVAGPHQRTDFPPLRSLDHLRNNLPVQLTSFVGREPELAVLQKLLPETRLLTLTGAGGCGKTRLALELAARVIDHHPDGAWLVDLAPVTDPKAIPSAVASAVGVREQQGSRLLDTLVDHFASQEAVLLLDNCEHLVEGAAEVAERLLVGCPALTILATSREQLGVPGETAWRVPSLSVPAKYEERGPQRLDTLNHYEAVQLFVERARKARPNFTVTNDNAPAVAAICQRLDGIPLAIELAAARTRMLSADQILQGLDDCFHLLSGGARTAVARQQTLRASVDWSYRLLAEPERVLLRRLSVFAGGFTLDAAEAVTSGPNHDDLDDMPDPINPLAVLDLLQGLVDKSLVLVDDAGLPRYRLLETIRQYASERLVATDGGGDDAEAKTVRDRHRDFYVTMAERAAPHLEGADQEEWATQLDRERQNLRAAFDWAHAQQDARSTLRMVAGLFWFWVIRGHLGEGGRLCRLALDLREHAPDHIVAPALAAACHVGWFRLDLSTMPFAQEAVDVARRCGDRRSQGRALYYCAWWTGQTDPAQSKTELDESIAIAREVGDRWGLAIALTQAGIMLTAGRPAPAIAVLEEAIAVCDDLGDRYIVNTARYSLARPLVAEGRTADAEDVLQQVIAAARRTGETYSLTMALADLGLVKGLLGDLEGGLKCLEEDVELFRARRLPWESLELQCYGCYGTLLWMDGRHEQAQQALRTALEISRRVGPWAGPYQSVTLALLADNEHALGHDPAARAYSDEALALLDGTSSWPSASARLHIARVLLALNEREAAERMAHEALAIDVEAGNHFWVNGTVSVLATLALMVADAQQAVRLLGADDALLEQAGQARPPVVREQYEEALARLRRDLGDDFDTAWAEGRRMSIEEAVAYARRGRGQRRRPASGWDSLTPAEQQIVGLVATGLSNPQIAERLFVSRKTVATHLTHVFAKLGLSSRAELSAEAVRRER